LAPLVLGPREAGVVLEVVSKISSAAVDDMQAATSSNFTKKSSVYLSGYTCGFFARFPCLASHLVNLATNLFLKALQGFFAIFRGGITASSHQCNLSITHRGEIHCVIIALQRSQGQGVPRSGNEAARIVIRR
jgi:hypothetical protein